MKKKSFLLNLMNILRLLPVILAFGLLAAHFSRANMPPAVVVTLITPFLLLIRKPWIAKSIQVLLLIGAAEWIRSMLGYIQVRKEIGEDWGRLAIILVTVALLTACSALVFRGKSLKKRYHLEKSEV
jgi:ABC-type multidrug transport system permease subunit